MPQQSRTVHAVAQAQKPESRHLPLVDLLIDTRAELTELVVRSGMKVLEAMLEEDRVAVCGPRYTHQPDREAGRGGTTASTVVLGGRKVQIRRPRVRAGKTEVPLPTFEVMAQTDPLNRRIVEQMLLGVATRRYARSLGAASDGDPEPRNEQEHCESSLRGADDRAGDGLADRVARGLGSGCDLHRRRRLRRALSRGRARHRCDRPETPARALGRIDRKRHGLPGIVEPSAESRVAHRPLGPGDSRRLGIECVWRHESERLRKQPEGAPHINIALAELPVESLAKLV
jgi:hypothetical protein